MERHGAHGLNGGTTHKNAGRPSRTGEKRGVWQNEKNRGGKEGINV